MELYTYTTPTVDFLFPDPATTAITATYSINNGNAVRVSPTVNQLAQKATVKIPYLDSDGQVDVTWTFTILGVRRSRTVHYEVVTTILSDAEIRNIIGQDATDDQVRSIEASTRYIIQAYTGQSFGKYVGPLSITGSGEDTLRMPRRLIRFKTVNGNTILPQWATLRGGGWFLVGRRIGVPPIRADYDGWNEATALYPLGLTWQTGAVIAPPSRDSRGLFGFAKGMEYVIDGEWGWDFIPGAVVEAAKLLVNDYACNDSIYRDRFIESISGPDWAISFNEGAYNSTGNVRADQLLGEYKLRRGWMVM